jgi:hypothetical protein
MSRRPAIHIAHLVNPVRCPAAAELTHTQPLTFESMRRAAERAGSELRVELLTTQYPQDHPVIPPYFRRTADLTRSAADMHSFTVRRELPLACDLLARLYGASEAPYLIYTNVDIILHPSFYL